MIMTDKLLEVAYHQYAPYGVKFKDVYGDAYTLCGLTNYPFNEVEYKDLKGIRQTTDIKGCKLLLRPTSCLTKPITVPNYNDGKEFVPIVELAKYAETQYFTTDDVNYSRTDDCYGAGWLNGEIAFAFGYFARNKSFYLCNENNDKLYMNDMGGLFDLMNQWLIDWRDLIGKGLAVEIAE